MDKLKKYVQQRTDDLNFDEPSPKLWGSIEAKIHQPKAKIIPLNILQISKWLAAACIIALAGLGVKSLLQPNNQKDLQPIAKQEIEVKQPETVADKKEVIVKTNPKVISNKIELLKSSQKKVNNHFYAANEVLKEIDSRFVNIVAYQKGKINNTPLFAENANYFASFKEQMLLLDDDEKTIRKKIRTEEFNMEFFNALITIYQQKLDVLKSLQFEMNKLNNKYKQNRGPIDSTNSYFINI